jgi:hypothetical protein
MNCTYPRRTDNGHRRCRDSVVPGSWRKREIAAPATASATTGSHLHFISEGQQPHHPHRGSAAKHAVVHRRRRKEAETLHSTVRINCRSSAGGGASGGRQRLGERRRQVRTEQRRPVPADGGRGQLGSMATRGRRGQVRMVQRWWTEDGLGRGVLWGWGLFTANRRRSHAGGDDVWGDTQGGECE